MLFPCLRSSLAYRRRIFLCGFTMLILSSSVFASGNEVSAPHTRVSLIAEQTTATAGEDSWIGIRFQLEPGWHIYWQNPGDSGEPPRVQWSLPIGIEAGPLQWPVPERIAASSIMDFGYSQSVLLMASLRPPDTFRDNTLNIATDVHWLVCRELCLPGEAKLRLTLPIGASSSSNPETIELFAAARRRLPQPFPASWKVSAQSNKDDFKLILITGQPDSNLDFLPIVPGQLDNLTLPVVHSTPQGAEVTLKKSDELSGKVAALKGLVLLSGSTPAAYLAEVTVEAPPDAISARNSKPASFPFIMGLAFLGGVILNLMPCVFPVLSIKAIGLLQASGSRRDEQRRLGLVYALGVLVSVWLLLGALLLLRAAGRQIGWGFQLQSPVFVVTLAAFLFWMGLSLAGLFEIGMSWMGMGGSLAARPGYAGSFFTGVLATVVATPCTAPFMGAAIGFALGQSSRTAFAVFTLLALGLAAPYLLLSCFPQWSRVLPRPGRWMETAKQVMAFPLFAAVIWLAWVFGQQAGMNAEGRLLCGLLLISIGAWLLGRVRRTASTLAAILLFALAIWFPLQGAQAGAGANAATAANFGRLHWEPFSTERVQQYRAEGKPVFVDFTAAWCLTCQVNERTVFTSAAVQEKLVDSGVVLLRADWTSYDPAITRTLASFGRSGVPFYLLYGKDANIQPSPLPELLTPQIVINALNQIN
jgi:thiol:disulfide interchange protein